MTTLITGATGLVGSRLLPRLVGAGVDCRTLVRDSATSQAGATAVEGDLFDSTSLARAVMGASSIVHLAALFRTSDTDLIWKTNLEGTRNLIVAAKAHAPEARFIMASTSNIYNIDTPRPGRETDSAAPTQAYPASKLAAENELRASGLNWSVQRFGFVYGEADGHLESLPRLADEGRINFHPAQRMSMIHHRDIAAAIILGLTGALDGNIVNICDDAPTTFLELFELVGGTIKASADPLTNPWHLHMDGSLARRLGFTPTLQTVYQAVRGGFM